MELPDEVLVGKGGRPRSISSSLTLEKLGRLPKVGFLSMAFFSTGCFQGLISGNGSFKGGSFLGPSSTCEGCFQLLLLDAEGAGSRFGSLGGRLGAVELSGAVLP